MLEKTISAGDIKIHYCIQKGIGLPLIFLHGGGGSLSAWSILLPFFKNSNYTLITVDFRGHGLSGKSRTVEDYILKNHAKDIFDIINKENINKAVIIGHCMGSMVASTFAAIYPQKVKRLILINTNYELHWLLCKTPIRQILYYIFDLFRRLVPFKKTISRRVDYSKFIGSSDIDLFRLKKDLDVLGVYTFIRQTMALFLWNGKKYLSKIKVPTLIIAGKKDLFYPKGTGEKVMKLNSLIRLQYVNSNHVSIINCPKEVYEKISGFLKCD